MLWECCIVRVEGGERSLWGFGEKGDDIVLWRGLCCIMEMEEVVLYWE